MRIIGNPITITLSEYASVDQAIKWLRLRANQIDFLVALLKEGGAKSRVELDELMYKQFGYRSNSATSLLGWFEAYGWVKSEVRTEETISVDVDEFAEKISVNPDGTVTLHRDNWHKPITVREATISGQSSCLRVKGKRDVQVRRKYYQWVV